MEDISDVYLTNYVPTIYTTPCTMHYIQNGKHKKCNIFAERNGVVVIVYNSTRNVLTLVKQFRAVAYFNCIDEKDRKGKICVKKYPAKIGITLEFCAGLEDKNIPTAQVAREEILEECGYEVSLDQLERITSIRNLTVTTGARSTFYYCEVTDEMRVSKGGGVDEEGENIEVVELPVDEVIKYASSTNYVSTPVNFMYGLYWFLYNKYTKK